MSKHDGGSPSTPGAKGNVVGSAAYEMRAVPRGTVIADEAVKAKLLASWRGEGLGTISPPRTEPEPPPPRSEDDYGAVPNDGAGKFPATKAEKMARRLAEIDLGILHDYRRLHGHRRINMPFRMWLVNCGVDREMVYSAAALGRKVAFT